MSTQAVSTGLNKSKLRPYIFYRIKNQRASNIMAGIFAATGFPMLALAYIIDVMSNKKLAEMRAIYTSLSDEQTISLSRYNEMAVIFLILAIVAMAGFALLVFLNAVRNYSYLHNRTNVDMNYSLPLTRKERFWGDFTASLLPVLAAYLISAIVGMAIIGIAAPQFYHPTDFTLNYIGTTLGSLWKMVTSVVLTGFVALVFLHAVVVFSNTLSARLFEAILYPVVICVVIPVLELLVYCVAFSRMQDIYSDVLFKIISATSPGGVVAGWALAFSDAGNIDAPFPIFNPVVLIFTLIFIALFILAAYHLNKKRATERVGLAFAFKAPYHVYISLIVLSIAGAFFVNSNNIFNSSFWLGLIITTLLVFVILEVITKRGFRKMHIVLLRYIATIGASALLWFGLVNVDSMGLWKYIPEYDKIEKVEFDAAYIFTQQNAAGHRVQNANFYTDPETIKTMLAIHENSVANKIRDKQDYPLRTWDASYEASYSYELDPNTNELVKIKNSYGRGIGSAYHPSGADEMFIQTLRVNFHLKNGKIVTRDVYLTSDFEEQMRAIYCSDEYMQRELDYINETMTKFNKNPDYAVNMDLFDKYNLSRFVFNKYEEFVAAYVQDYSDKSKGKGNFVGKAELRFHAKGKNTRFMESGYLDLEIYDDYTNVLELLAKQGIDLSIDYLAYTTAVIYLRSNHTGQSLNYNQWSADERITKLLEVGRPHGYIGEIQFGNRNLFIPIEYQELCESTTDDFWRDDLLMSEDPNYVPVGRG